MLAVLEPRISGDKAMRVVNSLGFTNHHIVDANGFSGGIWLLWNCSNIQLNIVACSSQSISAMITQGTSPWILTVAYAHPCPGIRKSLWNYLDGVSSTNNLPWLVTGDFNEIIDESEKKGGRAAHCNSGFADWIGRHHLVDLGFSGAEFTWCKKNIHGETLWERLDRGLCNITWRLKFPEGFVRHLPRVKSDHCPILISLNSAQCPRSEFKIFRFQAMWSCIRTSKILFQPYGIILMVMLCARLPLSLRPSRTGTKRFLATFFNKRKDSWLGWMALKDHYVK